MAVFQEKTVPRGTKLAGYAALAEAIQLRVPIREPSCVSDTFVKDSRRQEKTWTVFDQRYWPGGTLIDHLTFALRYENIDLLVLKRAFEKIPANEIEAFVQAAPTSDLARRAWFLYEMLTERSLEIEDAKSMTAIDLLDPKLYFTGKSRLSKRHRVRDNLLGLGRFCPTIRRTEALNNFVNMNLSAKAQETVGRTGAHLLSRAASFLLLADSRASFKIEGEQPPRNRLERWGRAIMQAGKNPLTIDEILRLHRVLIEDTRFVQPGLRTDGVFLGERDHSADPLPEFIGAKPEDLSDLMAGLLEANDRMREDGVDPVLIAAATAFNFVYVHPFQDGNGRMHRCLIHHVLAERKFTPNGMVFPVSSVMLDRIDDYRMTLQSTTGPLMPFVEWRTTFDRNVEVLNDTADFYRYFDCTREAEFLYSCVQRTVDEDLPSEIDYLRRHDEAMRRIMDSVEMPDRMTENLIAYIRHNGGKLSKRRREGEFAKLTEEEVRNAEQIVTESFHAEH